MPYFSGIAFRNLKSAKVKLSEEFTEWITFGNQGTITENMRQKCGKLFRVYPIVV